MAQSDRAQVSDHSPSKRHETLAFLFLAFVLFPLLSVIFVGGFGFLIWMQHLMFGPPVY